MRERVGNLLYVSQSLLSGDAAAEEVAQIAHAAQLRNADLKITGGLIYSGGHFAQLLEGSITAIEELMSSIRRDTRHQNIMVVKQQDTAERLMEGWAMAYSGKSHYVDQQLKHMIENRSPQDRQRWVGTLLNLIVTFRRA